jgi:predicted methyltransferase
MRLACTALAVTTLVWSGDAQDRRPPVRLFPPDQLGLLDPPDRAEWQQPDRIMDVLGIAEGSRVADLGAGSGWFTIRLARRVGPNGLVYAEDVQQAMIDAITRRVASEGLPNVRTILGTFEDPHLPAGLAAVLLVDTYPQISSGVSFLAKVARALAPSGRLGVVDFTPGASGGPGPPHDERLDPQVIVRDATAAGLRLLSRETFLRYQYLLVFGKS